MPVRTNGQKIHIHTLSVWRILNGDGVSMMLIPGLIRLIVVCRRNRIVWKRMMLMGQGHLYGMVNLIISLI